MEMIMDYKEKYEMALEGIQEILGSGEDSIKMSRLQLRLQGIFPELKESGDERIKNRLIKLIKMSSEVGGFALHKWEADEMLAWLEKQNSNIDNANKEYWRGYREGKQEILDKYAEIEKQGEQKPNPYSGTSFEYNGHTWGMCARDNGVEILFDGELKAFLSLEKSFIYPIHPQPSLIPKSAQETINGAKAEPKFKVGDLVVQNGLGIYKIAEVCESWYEVISYKDGIQYSIDFDKENDCHLWSIQDAKNGDVLVTTFEEDNMIVMYHSMCTIDTINVHCCLDNKFTRANLGVFDVEDVKPATKEQHDLLFTKMKEAEYEWDAENKELKKIEQKSDSFCREHCKGFQETGKCFADGDCKDKKEAEQKSAWSEEDECYMSECIGAIATKDGWSFEEKRKTKHWLKSLKERIGE